MNTDTKWNITGSLIKKIDLKESDIFCTEGRTLYIPVRYRFPLVEHFFTFLISQVPDFPGRHGHLRGDGRKRKLLEEVRDFWGVRHLPRECEEEQSHRRLLRTWRQIYILAAVQARQLSNSVKITFLYVYSFKGLRWHHRDSECDIFRRRVPVWADHDVEEEQSQEHSETFLCCHQARWLFYYWDEFIKIFLSLGEQQQLGWYRLRPAWECLRLG